MRQAIKLPIENAAFQSLNAVSPFLRTSALLIACIAGISTAQAQTPDPIDGGVTITFSPPAQYCMPSLEGNFDDFGHYDVGGQWVSTSRLDKATLKYNAIVPTELQSTELQPKVVSVFVGLKLRSDPGKLWLRDFYGVWTPYGSPRLSSGDTSPPEAFVGALPPLVSLWIFLYPIDLTPLRGDGEVWVGYGLRTLEKPTTADAFQEMLAHQRFTKIWTVGSSSSLQICLDVSKIVRSMPLLSAFGTTGQIPPQ